MHNSSTTVTPTTDRQSVQGVAAYREQVATVISLLHLPCWAVKLRSACLRPIHGHRNNEGFEKQCLEVKGICVLERLGINSVQREHFLVNSPWPLATGPGCRDTDNLPLNSDLPVTGMAHAPRMLWEKKKDSVVADSVG